MPSYRISTKGTGRLRLSTPRTKRKNSDKILAARKVRYGLSASSMQPLSLNSGSTEDDGPQDPTGLSTPPTLSFASDEEPSSVEKGGGKKRLCLSARRKRRILNIGLMNYKIHQRSLSLPNMSQRTPTADDSHRTTSPTSGLNDEGVAPRCPFEFVEDELIENHGVPHDILSEDVQIDAHKLVTEPGPPDATKDPALDSIKGNFIVDGQHFLRALRNVENHRFRCLKSRNGYLQLKTDSVSSFVWTLKFKCPECGYEEIVRSDPHHDEPPEKNLNIADSVVWGAMAMGGGYSNVEEIFSTIGVKPLDKKTFARKEEQIGKKWQERLFQSMMETGKRELELAMEAGDVDENGVPFITVIVDGGWSHRPHGHRFSAKSGVACVIGLRTGKLLHVDVRNKFCIICLYRQKNGLDLTHENCYRNWCGTSSGMESDMLVEAFRQSKAMHGLEYRTVIGDGDSSVYRNLREKVPYGLRIQKSECANHAVKNYTNALYNQKLLPQAAKKLLSPRIIQRLKKDARAAIYHVAETSGSSHELKEDLLNGPAHVMGVHDRCKSYFCEKTENEIILDGPRLVAYNFTQECLKPLVRKVNRLVHNDTSNLAENFMSLVAKFVGGKQVNRSNRGSYTHRTKAAALSFQHGPSWACTAVRQLTGNSPSTSLKRMGARRERALQHTKASLQKYRHVRRVVLPNAKDSGKSDYGPNCHEEDMEEEEFRTQRDIFLKRITLNGEEREELEVSTRGQSSNEEWFLARKDRLTASNFGCVSKRRVNLGKLVDDILYAKPFSCAPVEYGRLHESDALELYKLQNSGKKVRTCGLFVHAVHGFLGASPDALIDEDGILEIKCPHSAQHLSFEEATVSLKSFFMDKEGKLKKSHNHHYQVQGQLQITNRKYCDFAVWGPKFFVVQTIYRDDEFWEKKMLPKLLDFYYNHYLPEIIDPRKHRSMPLR